MSRASIRLILVLVPLRHWHGDHCGKTAGSRKGRPAKHPTAEERTKAFIWFNTLGFPDVKGRKLVRVATGRLHQLGNDPPQNTWLRGFLLEDNAGTFTVFTLYLTTEKFEKTPATAPVHEQVGYEVSDLATGAAAYLQKPPQSTQRGIRRRMAPMGHPLAPTYEGIRAGLGLLAERIG